MSAEIIKDFYKGETKSYPITIKRNGVAIDITNDTVYCTIKSKKSDVDASADIQVSNTVGEHTTPASGITTIVLSSTQTNALTAEQTYYYDFRLVESGGTVTTIPGGSFTVLQPITLAVTAPA